MRSAHEQIGLSFSDKGLVLAHVLDTGEKHSLQHYTTIPLSAGNEQQTLKKTVHEREFEGLTAVIVLPPKDYQIFLIEKPKVPANELKHALRFKMVDYLDFPIDEALVDFIELPNKSTAENNQYMYVIVAKKDQVEHMVEMVKSSGLKVKGVEICQSVLMRIAAKLEANEQGQALLHIDENMSFLILFKDKVLYMMRDIGIGFSSFQSEQQFAQLLALEIQRSIDYGASTLKNVTVTRLLLTASSVKNPQMLSFLSDYLGLPVREVEMTEYIDNAAYDSQDINYALGAAIGLNS